MGEYNNTVIQAAQDKKYFYNTMELRYIRLYWSNRRRNVEKTRKSGKRRYYFKS